MSLRSLPWSRVVAVVVLCGAALAGVVWAHGDRSRSRAPVAEGSTPVSVVHAEPPVRPSPREKSKHPPVTALRDNMLKHFHGNATHVFTSIPGFGMERLVPMYKKIPFEIPSFSPGELDHSPDPSKTPPPLETVRSTSLHAFKDPSRPLPSAKIERSPVFGNPDSVAFGSHHRDAIVHGLQLRMLDLVGLTDKDSPRAYSGGQAFELVRMTAKEIEASRASAARPAGRVPPTEAPPAAAPSKETSLQSRSLDFFEVAGVAELQQGKDVYIRTKDNAIRMLGALRASDDCLKCHTDARKGDLLGAFSYTFYSKQDLFKKGK